MIRTVSLSDICDIKIGRTPPRKQPQWFSESHGIKWVSIKDMGNTGKYISQTSEFLTADAIKKFNIPIIPAGTLLMSFKLTVGRLGFTEYDMCSNEAIAQLPIKDPDIVDNNYLYYYLKNFNFGSLSSTSSIATAVNSKTVKNISVNLPPLYQQKKIANILGSLDEKIELNRRMNETLEQLGQALFRHYFIDNSEVDSWESGEVSDVIRIYSGFAFKSKDFDIDGRYGLVTIKNVQDGSFIKDCTDHLSEPLPDKIPDHVHLKNGDIILSLTGNVGRVCAVVGHDYLLNQRVAKLVSDENQAYVYFLFRSKTMKDRMVGISKGTAQKNLSPIEAGKLKIKIPPTNIMSQFEESAMDLLNMIVSNNEQIQNLTSLRDTLLPKLISREIEV